MKNLIFAIAMIVSNRRASSIVTLSAIGAGGRRFNSGARQIGHTVAIAAVFLCSCVVQVLSCVNGSSHSCHALFQYREYNEDLINFSAH